MNVPFYRPSLTTREIDAVAECMRSGWITTGPITKQFEAEFATYVGAKHAIALNSCTAALHLALEAIGICRGDLVIVPTMTFAATAEVVRYFDAIPVFVDCEPVTQNISIDALEETLAALQAGRTVPGVPAKHGPVRAIIPVHFAGEMVDVDAIQRIAKRYHLRVVEDAAHTLPAAYRSADGSWRSVGTTAEITCFSFYANKCITTGEGGMAVTNDDKLAERMRVMSLHGMSKDAWKRYSGGGSWYYEVVAPGFKYNMTDIAAAIGRVQLARAEELLQKRRDVVSHYARELESIPGLELLQEREDRQHSWHLYPIKLDLAVWRQGRNALTEQLRERGVGCSVHWMPLHMHPYYRDTFALAPEAFPVAAALWPRLLTLPLYPDMTESEVRYVADSLRAALI
jgi:perosamine synthetase